jgi:hypothetical protein
MVRAGNGLVRSWTVQAMGWSLLDLGWEDAGLATVSHGHGLVGHGLAGHVLAVHGLCLPCARLGCPCAGLAIGWSVLGLFLTWNVLAVSWYSEGWAGHILD